MAPIIDDTKMTASKAHSKALAINLDATIYGTFAEIGAGQDVAQWFLSVGAASGTVAQTICAYDKAFSDDRYGKGTRYVSRERLLSMLEREYTLLRKELGPKRAPNTRYFSFADTVAARNFKGDNDQHGWMGLRFESEPGGPSSDILLHLELRDETATRQAQSLGVLGVNLLDAAYHHRQSASEFLTALYEGLSRENLELDVIELTGPAFSTVDPRLWCIRALRQELCHAVVFDQSGHPVEPSTLLRKRPLIVESGRFESIAPFQRALLSAAERQLSKEFPALPCPPTTLIDMAVRDSSDASTSDEELLARVDGLVPLAAVAVTDLAQSYRLVEFLRRYTTEPIRLAVGVSALAKLLVEDYQSLPGALLEGLGKLLVENVRLYVSAIPLEACQADLGSLSEQMFELPAAGSVTVDHLRPQSPLDELLRYLRAAKWLIATDSA